MEIIILAMVAGFIALRLYSVLGRHNGSEQQSDKPFSIRDLAPQPTDSPVGTSSDSSADIVELQPDPAQDRLLGDVMAIDRRFDPQEYVSGANGAYEMIIEAFAKGDRYTLVTL